MRELSGRSSATRRPILPATAAIMVISGIILSGCVTTDEGALVKDARGRFAFRVPEALQTQPTDGSYFHYLMGDQGIHTYVIVKEDPNEERAVRDVLQVGGLIGEPKENGTATMGDWALRKYIVPDTAARAAVAYQYRSGTLYAMLVRAEDPDVDPGAPPLPIMRMLESITFTESAGELFKPADVPQFEKYVREQAAVGGGSISIAVLRRDKVVYTYATGERNLDTPTDVSVAYNWGSITKLVTATAVMQQVEAGRISLDAPIDTYLPEFPAGHGITVRNLLTHSSGLKDFAVTQIIGLAKEPLPSLEAVLAGYLPQATETTFRAGATSAYNNWNFLLLAVIVERVSGVPFVQYASHAILDPLGMTETSYRTADLLVPVARSILSLDDGETFLYVMASHGRDGRAMITARTDKYLYLDHYDILPAWAGLKGSARDALRFAAMYLDGGRLDGARVLKRPTVRAMLTMQKATDGQALGLGLAWFIGGDERGNFAQHAGGGPGINSLLRIYPGRNLAVAVMGNSNDYNPDKITAYAADLAIEGRFRVTPNG